MTFQRPPLRNEVTKGGNDGVTDLLIRGSNVAVVVFVVSSTLIVYFFFFFFF